MTQLNWKKRLASPSASSTINIILLHGFGANAADLSPLSDILDPARAYNWYMADAPVPIQAGSLAWFPRKQTDLDQALRGELWGNLARYDSPDINHARDIILSDMEALGLKTGDTVMAGFSQGSMMALACAIKVSVRGLVLWSSALYAKQRITRELETVRIPPFIQTHGKRDTVLPVEGARELFSLLSRHQEKSQWLAFDGDHEISMEVLNATSSYLKSVSGGRQP